MAEPATVPEARCKTSLASAYGLASETSPAFTLPVSPLLSTLLLDINSDLSKFLEDQTVHGFLPMLGRRHRRYYGTSTSSFPGPYTVPPGLTSITMEKASEVRKRSVSLSASQVSSMETMLSGMCEVSSWLDWWLSTCGGFRDHLPIEVRSDFERLMISGSRALEFLASQGYSTLGNLFLVRRDALLADVRGTVPAEEVARLRYSPLPQSAAIFPNALLDSALLKMRAAASDALVQRTLHPPRIPRKPASAGQSGGSSTAHAGQAGTSGATQTQKQSASSSTWASLVRGRRKAKARLPFPLPPEAPAAREVRAKEPGRSQRDGVLLPMRVGGCLSPHWRQWQAIGAETWVVTVLRDGYRVPFTDSPPPLARTPVSFPTYRAGSPRAQALLQEVEAMLAKGALEIARDPGPGFYSRLFLVEKATGGWRPVIDLSHLNDFVQLTSFKMETVASVLLSVREGDFLASLDLKDAYFQIPIHGSSRKLLRFMSEGTVYQFKALCFGLSTAPQVFTRVFAAVSAWAHSHGIRLLRYLDDWLVLSSSEKKAKESIRELLSLCHTLGIVINEKKSDLVPSQSAKYLSMTIDTGAGKVFPSLARVEKFLTVAERFCSMQSPPAQLWQVILSHLASLERLVPHGRLRMRSLQWHLKMHWSPESDPPSLPVALPEEVRRDLSWWMVRDHLLVGVRFGTPAPDLHLYSDASSSGWGAHLLDQNVSGVWSAQEKLLHINLLEMKALFLGLQAFQEVVAGHHVTAMCDNSTVVAYVNKRGHGVQVPMFVDQPPSEMDGEFRRPSRCEVSTRRVQRPGRCSQPSRASCRDRVVSPPSGGESTSSSVGQSVNRSVCDLPQREAAPVLLVCPGSTGRLRGCVSPSLGRPGSVRVRSLSSGRSGDRPRPRVVACRDDSGRASLAREGVVCRLAASTDPTTPGSTLLGQTASATPLQSVPSRRPRAEPSRVATLKRHYRKSGFSGRAARVLSGVLRGSSSRLYQSRWKIFCGWCRGRSVAPVNASVPVVVDFLIHLRQDKGLSVSAVKDYCSALNSVLALKGLDLAASREITTLLRSFARSVNPVELRPPAWDVSLVLQSLTGAPYEPLRTCEERFLAQKTLFLLALASAKRIGELHALSYRVSHTRDWGEVSFAFVTGFVAKTQDPSSLAPRFEGFTVPALPNARKNRNGRLLCPVRAVKVYLDRTASHRPRCER